MNTLNKTIKKKYSVLLIDGKGVVMAYKFEAPIEEYHKAMKELIEKFGGKEVDIET